MNSNPEIAAAVPPGPRRMGLAIASLVLGVLACALSLFVVGALFGLAGLALGLAHILQKRGPKGMAWWGIGLSIVSILASVGSGVVYYRIMQSLKLKAPAGVRALADWEGAAAPDISLTTLEGKNIKLSQLKGKRVVLDFWATWCGPCIEEIPNFIKLLNQTSRDDLVLIGISDEDEATLKPFVAKNGMSYPVASARDLPSPYGDVEAIPTTFFIDRNGVIQSILVGARDFNELKARALSPDFEGEPRRAPSEKAAAPEKPARHE